MTVATMMACSSDDDPAPTNTEADSGVQSDSATAAPDATDGVDGATPNDSGNDSANPAAACTTASASLASTADAQAPVLDAATSNLQRITSNDTFCANQKAGAHPTFGAFGYALNVFMNDADGDGPTLDELTTAGVVRLGSSPTFTVTDKFDLMHGFSTQGQGFILQLCLDQVYPPGTITVAVDVADKAGHRSKAICVEEASGG